VYHDACIAYQSYQNPPSTNQAAPTVRCATCCDVCPSRESCNREELQMQLTSDRYVVQNQLQQTHSEEKTHCQLELTYNSPGRSINQDGVAILDVIGSEIYHLQAPAAADRPLRNQYPRQPLPPQTCGASGYPAGDARGCHRVRAKVTL